MLLRTTSILHIEDNDGDLALTREALSEIEFQVEFTACTNGQEGLDYLNELVRSNTKTLPNLILLDINLPIVNGFDVLKAIKTNPLLNKIPVVIFSTSSFQNDIYKAYHLSANCFVSKPIDIETFFYTIKSITKFWMKTA